MWNNNGDNKLHIYTSILCIYTYKEDSNSVDEVYSVPAVIKCISVLTFVLCGHNLSSCGIHIFVPVRFYGKVVNAVSLPCQSGSQFLLLGSGPAECGALFHLVLLDFISVILWVTEIFPKCIQN